MFVLPARILRRLALATACTCIVLGVVASPAFAVWNVTVSNAPTAHITRFSFGGQTQFEANATGANVNLAELEAALAVNDTEVYAASDFAGTEPGIITTTGVTISSTSTRELSFSGGQLVAGPISINGPLWSATPDGVTLGGTVRASAVTASASSGPVTVSGDITSGAGVSLVGTSVTMNGTRAVAAGGNVTFHGTLRGGTTTVTAPSTQLVGGTASGVNQPVALTINGGLSVGTTSLGTQQDLTVTGSASLNAGATTVTSQTGSVRLGGIVTVYAIGFDTPAGSASVGSITSSNGTPIPSFTATTPVVLTGTTYQTSGAQSWGALSVTGAASLVSSSNAAISVSGAVNGPGSLAVTTGGATTFSGTIGASTALSGLTIGGGGATTFAAGSITTGTASFGDAFVLTTPTTVASPTAGAITFANRVDGMHPLVVNSAGVTTFAAAVGGVAPLAALTTDAAGSTVINGGAVTAGSITLGDALTLGADTILSGGITTLAAVSGARSLMIPGAAVLNGNVGDGTSLTTLATGAATLGANITTSGAQTYGALTVSGAVRTVSAGAAPITFLGTISGSGVTNGLVANSSDVTTFTGAVDGSTGVLRTDAPGSTRTDTTGISADSTSFGDPVVLGADLHMAANDVTFHDTVDSAPATASMLDLLSCTAVTIEGAVGSTTPPILVAVGGSATDTLSLGAPITASLSIDVPMVELTGDATLTAQGVAVHGTLDGTHALSLATSSSPASLHGEVGGMRPPTTLATNGANVHADVTTTGTQT